MQSGQEVTRQASPIRQAPLQTAEQDRDHVRQTEGLAPDRYPLRQVRQDLPLSRRTRRHRYLLALMINEYGA